MHDENTTEKPLEKQNQLDKLSDLQGQTLELIGELETRLSVVTETDQASGDVLHEPLTGHISQRVRDQRSINNRLVVLLGSLVI